MSVEESLSRGGGVDGRKRCGVDYRQGCDDWRCSVRDGHWCRDVVNDRAERGVSVPLNGAVREVASHALGVHHGAVKARGADQRRGRGRGVQGGGRDDGRRVVGDYAGFGGRQGDGSQQQRYHNDLHMTNKQHDYTIFVKWHPLIGVTTDRTY